MPFNNNNFLPNNQLGRNVIGGNFHNGNFPNMGNNVLPNLVNANLVNTASQTIGNLNTIGLNLPQNMNTSPQMTGMNNANSVNTNFPGTNFMNTNLPNPLLGLKNTPSSNLIERNLGNVQLNPMLNNLKNADLISNKLIGANVPNSLGNNPNSYLALLNTGKTSNSIANANEGIPAFGLHILADALEVGGTVSIAGHIPIYGTVVMNGNVPTDGAASVNYNCA